MGRSRIVRVVGAVSAASLAVLLVLMIATAVGGAPPATAALPSGVEQITAYDSNVRIQADGTLLVRETIHYDFGVVPRHGIFRDIPDRFDYPPKANTDRVTPITVVSVRASAGTPADYSTSDIEQSGTGLLQLKIGDPDRLITGAHTYEITYRVKGALNGFADHDELVWNAVGAEWSVPVSDVTAEVSAPAAIPRVACTSGPPGSTLACESGTAAGRSATFRQAALDPHHSLTFTVALPKGAVPTPKPILEARFDLAKAFTVNGATVGGAAVLLVALVGGYLLLFRRTARDRRFKGSAVDQAFGTPGAEEELAPVFEHTETPVEFVPPDGLRPGQIGTLVDFAANPLDVSATIVDLAVRKYLVIEEIPPTGHFSSADWKLTKLKEADDTTSGTGLKEYERVTLDSLFRNSDEVTLSSLRNKFAARMTTIRTDLMDDAMAQGWFTHRPERARGIAAAIGVVILAAGIGATIALAALTHAALVGVPLIIFGVLVLATARLAPARTAKGSAVMRHVDGFRRFIEESEKERARFAERKNLFSEYLPYAIVFGATKKWAHAFAGLDGADPAALGQDGMSWYRSSGVFDYLVLATALDSFTVSTAGTLTSTPAATSGSSGFSGGGFSGGGFGGGGGGSW